ncbi:hypothetical protein M427DRAFT_34436 [Gonapodya prolifera JEL478]|uniref:Uncharacterized protein n=1 Tax=Gonapodya prolifera (strain JEL478) TaxID=1344416 RepID=A0A139A7X5_GONPJ|nr:hypothetical protein M427DRAFT_34436 [Gonapodya prolifera JEL478]|eukprot:KXS12799.1 hypothetical protein M427DRAFT_34436 [Gonapodya prolifera JEL478]
MDGKLYKLIFRVQKSPQTCKLYTLQFLDPSKARELVAPIGTWWKLDFNAISQAMQDRKEAKKLLASDRSLWELKLLEEEWNYLEKVRKLLEGVVYPTIVLVVPLFNIIMDRLEDKDLDLEPLLVAVGASIMEVLQKCYGKTDNLKLYWTALVLHPAYKLLWMQEQQWEAVYIQQADNAIRTVYHTGYSNPGSDMGQGRDEGLSQDLIASSIFDNDEEMVGELDWYLRLQREDGDKV